MKTIIGIIGGMGPMATCDLMKKIILHTDAESDQEHLHILVDCNTNIPDRTAAIIDNGESPLPEMIKSALRLQAMGAQALVVACNTAHFFLEDLQKSISIPIISILNETAVHLHHKGFRSVAVLGTYGTICSGVYGNALTSMDISCTYPNNEDQQFIMSLIYDYVKAGKMAESSLFLEQLKKMSVQGAQAFVLGCTELPMVFQDGDFGIKFIDSLDVMAKRAVEMAGYPLKQG